MNHKTKILEYRKLSDGQFAVKIQCCDDEQHASWHTMHASVASDDESRLVSIGNHRQRVADLHDHALKAEAAIKQHIGEEIEHS